MGWFKGWKILILWGFTQKSDFQGGGFTKKQYIGANCLKRGAWTVCRFKECLAKKRGGECFWGGVDTPMHTMEVDDF